MKTTSDVIGGCVPRLVGGRCLPWTPAEEQFLRDNAATKTRAQIAEALGRSVGSVKAKAAHYGVILHKTGQLNHRAKFTDATVEKAKWLRKQGWKFTEIAKLTGASPFTIPAWCEGRIRNKIA